MKMQKETEHSISLEIKINELELELIRAKVEKVVIEDYKKGIEDCRQNMKFELSLPSNLKKEHVAQIFQCELPTVEKIIRMEGFPNVMQLQLDIHEIKCWSGKTKTLCI